MPETIPRDSTILSVAPTLKRPRDFAANILHLMRKAEQAHGPVVVRIGITGMGIFPNFRIESTDGKMKTAYDGVTYKPFGEIGTVDQNWGTRSSTLQEVADLVAQLTKFQREKAGYASRT